MNSDLLFSPLGNGLTEEKIKCDILSREHESSTDVGQRACV